MSNVFVSGLSCVEVVFFFAAQFEIEGSWLDPIIDQHSGELMIQWDRICVERQTTISVTSETSP
jgi:hypothetical protein